jgi:hypothetical protein
MNSDHITGFAIGVGVAAAGFYLYKKNQARVDDWLRQQGINVQGGASRDIGGMSLEELVTEKERYEDAIAEREHAMREEEAAQSGAAEA